MADGEAVKIKEEPVDDIGENNGTNRDEQTKDEEDMKLSQLIAENQRLQRVFVELNNRQSILEEFIEVEYDNKFDAFLQNRERLVNVMGLGESEDPDKVDGKRSAKSAELVKLLKVVKSQAESNSGGGDGGGSSANSGTGPRGQGPQQGQQKRGGYNPHQHGGKKSRGRGGGNFNRYY